jgi:hypothetical protein
MALLETSWATAEAARYLKVAVSRIRQRLRERSFYGIDYKGNCNLMAQYRCDRFRGARGPQV